MLRDCTQQKIVRIIPIQHDFDKQTVWIPDLFGNIIIAMKSHKMETEVLIKKKANAT